ncbi:hypothetical protein Anas_02078 [Armadillidium nasatum]|uniref:Uncharacterized protein n=1 Tax=Armadillidium nasatum TaxID=96803 RepID=A0A5N5TMD3_9CRUS|nr:hypothetical protein Anas_02078 [Armadillidium nasatum]
MDILTSKLLYLGFIFFRFVDSNMPRLHCRHTSCCFCLSLQAGCKIIGVLTAFICGLELVSACHQLIELLERERRCTEDSDKWEELEAKSFLNICPHIKFVQFMLILDFIKFVIGFNGSILLLYGIKTILLTE